MINWHLAKTPLSDSPNSSLPCYGSNTSVRCSTHGIEYSTSVDNEDRCHLMPERKCESLDWYVHATRHTSEAEADVAAESNTGSLQDWLINPGKYEALLPTTEEHTAAEPNKKKRGQSVKTQEGWLLCTFMVPLINFTVLVEKVPTIDGMYVFEIVTMRWCNILLCT